MPFDAVLAGAEEDLTDRVVPLLEVRAGDRQVGVYRSRGQWRGGGPVNDLDPLADFPEVTSVVGEGEVVARRPLPAVVELAAFTADEETLLNLPNLRRLALHRAPGGRPLDAGAVTADLVDLRCSADTFGSVEALTRFSRLERLVLGLASRCSAEPLAQLSGLRLLHTDADKRLKALGALTGLEDVDLSPAGGSLASLRCFAGWTNLRSLRLRGRTFKSLDGAESFGRLQRLVLHRTAVPTLDPTAQCAELRELRVRYPRAIPDVAAIARLSGLVTLEIDLTTDADIGTLPTVGFLAGLEELRDLELRARVGDGDHRPIDALTLDRATIVCPTDEPADPLAVHAGEGEWFMTGDFAALLDADGNHDARVLVMAAIEREDRDLAGRVVLDSEASALTVVAAAEDDIKAVREILRSLG